MGLYWLVNLSLPCLDADIVRIVVSYHWYYCRMLCYQHNQGIFQYQEFEYSRYTYYQDYGKQRDFCYYCINKPVVI